MEEAQMHVFLLLASFELIETKNYLNILRIPVA